MKKPEAPALPEWFTRDLIAPFEAGIATVFVLHGDVGGLFPNPDADDEEGRAYLALRPFLEKVLDGGDLVAFYDVASGLTFLRPDMERRLVAPGAADPQDPVAQAKVSLASKRGLPREPDACLPLLEKALRTTPKVALVLESAHQVAPTVSPGIPLPLTERANVQRLRNWARDDSIRDQRNMVLLVTEQASKLSAELRIADGGIPLVFIPKPTQGEREAFLRATGGPDGRPAPKSLDVDGLARAAQGMSLRQIEEVLLRAREAGAEPSPEFVKLKKRDILNAEYGDVMEVVEASRGLEDLGGCAHIKAFFRQVLASIQGGDARLVPMGITLMGPPGTGKTALVEALAKEASFHFVKTRNVRSMWVGESEARMEKLVNGLRSLAPVVVMNDEADLAEGGRDSPRGDSGVSERLMKSWMELLSDPRIRGQIIVINCTNRPDRIDPALKRSGRSDERILVPMPSAPDRADILARLLKRHAIPTSVADFAAFAEDTEGLSGADLEKVALSAWRFAREQGKDRVDEPILKAAIADFIPSASQAEIDLMTISGLGECSSRRLLPPDVEEIVLGIRRRGLVAELDEVLKRLGDRGVIAPEEFVPKTGPGLN